MASLYAQYIKERTDTDIIESDVGFVSYKLHKDKKQLHIEDCFIVPAKRSQKIAKAFFDQLVEIAAANDCEYLACTTDMNNVGWERATENLYDYGFVVSAYNDDEKVIYLIKELCNG